MAASVGARISAPHSGQRSFKFSGHGVTAPKRALAQPTARHQQRRWHCVRVSCSGVVAWPTVGVVIQRQDELAGGAGGVLVAEPNHVRVALATTARQVDHGPSIGNHPKGSLTGQLWPSPASMHVVAFARLMVAGAHP